MRHANPNVSEAAGLHPLLRNFGDGKTDKGTSATDSHVYAVAGTLHGNRDARRTAWANRPPASHDRQRWGDVRRSGFAIGLHPGGDDDAGVWEGGGEEVRGGFLDDSGSGFSRRGRVGMAGSRRLRTASHLNTPLQLPAAAAPLSWQASGVTPGSYLVQATWNASANHTSAAAYSIYDGSTLVQTVTVNQQLNPSGPIFGGVPFQTLASVPLTGGTIRVVLVSQPAGNLV